MCLAIFSLSCKSELEKIDIDDVEKHRAYQDTILSKTDDLGLKFIALKKLIAEYKLLEGKIQNQNTNYYYYLSRLYGKCTEFPVKGFWMDTISNKINNEKDYSNYYDSSYYYAEKSLKITPTNIRSMYIFCFNFYFEEDNFKKFNKNLPFSYLRDKVLWSNRLNYLVSNALQFKYFDTTIDKYLSRGICEISLYFQFQDQIFENKVDFVNGDQVRINKLYSIGEHLDYVKNGKPVFIKFKDKFLNDEVYPSVSLARDEIKKRQIEEQKLENVRKFGSKYVGSWKSDINNSKIYIYEDGTYKIVYTNEIYGAISTSEGFGKWDCNENSITFTTTSGESVAIMYSAYLDKNTVTFSYNNVFAPRLCLETSEGHVDFCFGYHNKE